MPHAPHIRNPLQAIAAGAMISGGCCRHGCSTPNWDSASTWYLGALTLGTFTIQVTTGLLLMLYYHPSIPQGYADMKDLEFVVSSGVHAAQPASLVRPCHGIPRLHAHGQGVLSQGLSASAGTELDRGRVPSVGHLVTELYGVSVAVGPVVLLGHYRGGEHHFFDSMSWVRSFVSTCWAATR